MAEHEEFETNEFGFRISNEIDELIESLSLAQCAMCNAHTINNTLPPFSSLH
jgi:hypothetical protein